MIKSKTTKTLTKWQRKKIKIKKRMTILKNIIYVKLELRIKLKINKTLTKKSMTKVKNQKNKD
jgi:hypothetical protein